MCYSQTIQMAAHKNQLYYGDNLQVLRDSIATESVDLVYPHGRQCEHSAVLRFAFRPVCREGASHIWSRSEKAQDRSELCTGCAQWRHGCFHRSHDHRPRLQQFSNRYTPKPQQLSGFFLKKKPPFTVLYSAHKLENCSKACIWP